MQLVELRVKNFRAIGNEITIRFYTKSKIINSIFLIGKNNTGKSSVLEAYDYFSSDKSQKDIKEDDFHNKQNIPIEISVIIKWEENKDQQELIPLFGNNRLLIAKKVWSREKGETSKVTLIQNERGEWRELTKGKEVTKFEEILEKALPKPVWVRGMSTSSEVITLLQKLIKEAVLENFKQNYEEKYQEAETAIRELQSLVKNDGYTTQLQERMNKTIQQIFPQISLLIHNQGGELDLTKIIGEHTEVRAIEEGKPDVNLKWQGHGVQRQFILSAYKDCHDALGATKKKGKKSLSDFDLSDLQQEQESVIKTKILLIEEPELYLHPTAVRSIQKLLYDLADHSEFQVLCATHSPIMIDLGQPQSSLVRMASCNGHEIIAHQVNDDVFKYDEQKRLRMLREFNPYVCEAFFADRVLLVEGATEIIAVKILFEKIRQNSSVDNLLVVNCGGKGTIELFQKILRHFHIPYFVFHDSDFRYRENGDKLNVWTTNQNIWNEIEEAKKQGIEACRFVFVPEFESDNEYSPPANGKPLVAYKQIQSWLQNWDNVQNKPVIKYLKIILGQAFLDEEHNQTWIEQQLKQKNVENAPSTFIDEPQLSFDMFP